MSTKNKFKRRNAYKKYSITKHKSIALLTLLSVILSICIILDRFFSYKYNICPFFTITDETFSTFFNFNLVVWTFSVSLIVFYLGRTEVLHYGIQLSDLAKELFNIRDYICILLAILIQLGALLFAVLFEYKVTIFFCTISHLLTMIAILIFICTVNSNSYAKNQIINSFKNDYSKLSEFFVQMLQHMDYSSEKEIDDLDQILIQIVGFIKEQENTTENKSSSNPSTEFICVFFDYLLSSLIDIKLKENIINHYLNQFTDINLQKGVIKSVLENLHYVPDISIENILIGKFPNRDNIILWGFTYNMFLIGTNYIYSEYNLLSDDILRRFVLSSANTATNSSYTTSKAFIFWNEIYQTYSQAENSNDNFDIADSQVSPDSFWKLHKENILKNSGLTYNKAEVFWDLLNKERSL